MPLQDDLCIHTGKNPWQNQNPEWETTERNFIYDDNGQLIKCTESRGKFDKGTYTYEYDEAGNRTFAKKEKLYSYLESWQIRYLVVKKFVLDLVESILKEPVYLLMRQIRLSQKMLLRKRKH